MNFPVDTVPGSSQDSVLPQFHSLLCVALPIHQFFMDFLLQKWKDPDSIALPHFMSPLEDMEKLPEVVHFDSVVAILVGSSSMVEENILKNRANKKVGSSVKKA
ncbi:hypothetical protein NDU88_002088 [Pleurodeles waltl]|uniref:Uncharacterized protein n=1 Tax=Pleurodeles waltl TaxID=8319 RepID=A0AAV7UYP3_PLEWA|nr:hypothetical protein NDU88_002088 [Pleurodeles waltl]